MKVNVSLRGLRHGLTLIAVIGLLACSPSKTPKQHVASADEYMRQGELQAASIELRNALQQEPNLPEARFMLAKVYVEQGKNDAALKELGRAADLGVEEDLWLVYARIYNATREPQLLLDSLPINVFTSQASQAEYAYLVDLARYDVDQRDKIAAPTAAADDEDPYTMLHRALAMMAERDFAGAEAAISQQLQQQDEFYQGWALLTRLARNTDNLALFEEGLAKQTRIRPFDYHARALLTSLLIEQDRIDDAKPHVAILLKLSKDHPLFNFYAAVVAFESGDQESARRHVEVTLNAYPDYQPARTLAAILAYERGSYERAENYLGGLEDKLPPDHPLQRLIVALDTKTGALDEAADRLFALPDLNAKDVPMMRLLAKEMAAAGQLEASVAMMERAHQLDPDPSDVYALGGMHWKLGNINQALGLLGQKTGVESVEFERLKLLFASYLQQQNLGEARVIAGEIVQTFPSSAEGDMLLAMLAMIEEDTAQAATNLEDALAKEPFHPASSLLMYRLKLVDGELDAGRNLLVGSIGAHPTHQRMLDVLFEHDRRLGLLNDDLALFERAHEQDPEDVDNALRLAQAYVILRQYPQAQRLLKGEVAELAAAQPLQIAIYEGNLDYNNALDSLLKWKALQPDSLAPIQWESKLRMLRGEYPQALAANTLLLESVPDLLHAQIDRAFLLWVTGDEQAFESQLQQVVERAPKHPQVLELQAKRNWQLNNNADALVYLQELYEVKKDEKTVRLLADGLKRAEKTTQAKALLKQWIEDNPADFTAQVQLTEILMLEGCSDDVIANYRAMLQGQAESLVALNNLAWCLNQRGQVTEAGEFAAKAYELYPGRPEVLDTYGVILLEQGKHKLAMRMLEKARTLSDDPGIGYHVALALSQNQRNEEARALLEALLASHPSFPERSKAQQLLSSI